MACLKCKKPIERFKHYCSKCEMDLRSDFRNLVNRLEIISNLERFEASYMRGFSYAEKERFSMIFMKIKKRFSFPIELDDFVNKKEEAKKIYKELESY